MHEQLSKDPDLMQFVIIFLKELVNLHHLEHEILTGLEHRPAICIIYSCQGGNKINEKENR